MEKNAYCGEVQVQDDCFNMSFERLIVRDNELAFVLIGNDNKYGGFVVDGVAKALTGFYLASKLPLRYVQYSEMETVTIKFDIVKEDNKGCYIKGYWVENREDYPFSAYLVGR